MLGHDGATLPQHLLQNPRDPELLRSWRPRASAATLTKRQGSGGQRTDRLDHETRETPRPPERVVAAHYLAPFSGRGYASVLFRAFRVISRLS